MDFILKPWPWYTTGFAIALTFALVTFSGKAFGVSSNLRTICCFIGAGKICGFFKFDWKTQLWNIAFLVGGVVGGFIGAYLLKGNATPNISAETINTLQTMGFSSPEGIVPKEIFDLSHLKSWIILLSGGFMVGFGARYAGGCTSGHAITGLSHLQFPSLIAVVGFFIGGLTMSWFFFPQIFGG